MIDFLIGLIVGALLVGAYVHFFPASAAKASPSLDLETVLEGVRIHMSQFADDLAAKIAALPAELEAKFSAQVTDLTSQLDAEKADHAADLTKLSDAVNAVSPTADPAA